MLKVIKTEDIRKIFLDKLSRNDFRIISNNVQQSKTLEIQDASFLVDKPWIVKEPNYEYAANEIKWYESLSLNVNDIPNKVPEMWKACATEDGFINSNYGWAIFSDENFNQFDSCLNMLLIDNHTREAVMIYDRPSMQVEYNKNGMHDFMCCQYVQYFINKRGSSCFLDCIANFRSNDAVFGFNNDALWMKHVQRMLADKFNEKSSTVKVNPGNLYWHAGSLHIYQRHFKFLQ